MTKFQIYDEALENWELRSVGDKSKYCSFCKEYQDMHYCYENETEKACKKCPLFKYGAACGDDDSLWNRYIFGSTIEEIETAEKMHMLIHLISLSEGLEIY